jgi:hypothetical protein
MNMTRVLFAAVLLGGSLFTPPAHAQTALRSTSFAVAVASSDTEVTLASGSGIEAGDLIFADREAMQVIDISRSPVFPVRRGFGGIVTTHASGLAVYADDKTYFSSHDRAGSCTSTAEVVLPVVNIASGRIFDCFGGNWTERRQGEVATYKNIGTPATGVTAVEYGDSRHHFTKLTFTGITVGSPASAAALGIGGLLYTFPAGALSIKAGSLSVALSGSGSTCDADTPVLGLGTVVGAGAVSVLSGTATFVNIMAGTAVADVNGTVLNKTLAQSALLETATSARAVYLNAAATWAGACTVTATGSVVVEWAQLLP